MLDAHPETDDFLVVHAPAAPRPAVGDSIDDDDDANDRLSSLPPGSIVRDATGDVGRARTVGDTIEWDMIDGPHDVVAFPATVLYVHESQ